MIVFIKCINTWQRKTLWELYYNLVLFFCSQQVLVVFWPQCVEIMQKLQNLEFCKSFLTKFTFHLCFFSKLCYKNLWARSEVCCEHSKGARRCWAAPTRPVSSPQTKHCCVSETQDEVDIESHFWFGALLVGWKWIVCGLTTGGLRWEANEC